MLVIHDTAPAATSAVDAGQERGPAQQGPLDIDSRRLLQGQREIRIRHGNEYYRLRHTRNDKLILTK